MSDRPEPDPDNERTIIRPKPGGSRAAPQSVVPPLKANPFDDGDSERTIIRPKPGGMRGAPAAAPPPQAGNVRGGNIPEAPAAPAEPPPIYTIGGNKLAAVAEPLVLLLARLWNAPTKPFQGNLRESTIEAFRVFEKRARDIGVPMDQLRPAHYALCAAIDDVVTNTPWAGSAGWDAGPLTTNFHQERKPGERFFDQLNKLGRKPEALPVVELMHTCLSLGFMGPYRNRPDGAVAVERIRQQTHDLIVSQRASGGEGESRRALSPQWKGVAAPYHPGRARFPIWVVAAAAVAVVAGLFALCLVLLDGASDRLYARMLSAPPATMPKIIRSPVIVPPPPPPPPPEPTVLDRLRETLRPEIEAKSVEVMGTPALPVIRLPSGPIFAAANANVQPAGAKLLERVVAAVKAEAARPEGAFSGVQVVAYTDSQPVKTVRFPSNFKLSAARAEAVRAWLQKALGKAPPVAAEGRGDADPVADNATPEGRAQNSRVEILLRRQ